jgi:hypothetical protein
MGRLLREAQTKAPRPVGPELRKSVRRHTGAEAVRALHPSGLSLRMAGRSPQQETKPAVDLTDGDGQRWPEPHLGKAFAARQRKLGRRQCPGRPLRCCEQMAELPSRTSAAEAEIAASSPS